MKFEICLKTIEDVKQFAKIANNIPVEITVTSGKYTVDGKSIMGLFSLNLNNVLIVETDSEYVPLFDVVRKQKKEGEL